MGLLKNIWNGFGDLYDSVENSSGNDYSENNCYESPHSHSGPKKVRVTWRGNYKSTSGCWCSGFVDEVIPEDMYRRLSIDGRATTLFLKRVIYDSEEFEYEMNYLSAIEYVDD